MLGVAINPMKWKLRSVPGGPIPPMSDGGSLRGALLAIAVAVRVAEVDGGDDGVVVVEAGAQVRRASEHRVREAGVLGRLLLRVCPEDRYRP